eukprot:3635984-Pyramimonas_sp.AAC.1
MIKRVDRVEQYTNMQRYYCEETHRGDIKAGSATFRMSACYRITYQSRWNSLSKERARDMQNELRPRLAAELGVELR